MMRLQHLILVLVLVGILTACDDSSSSASSSASAPPDKYYNKLGLWDHDVDTYKKLQIDSCQTVQQKNPDYMKPPADADTLRHLVRLYAQCQSALEHQHAKVGVLRVNDLGFGVSCVALAMVNTSGDVDEDCNIKSYLPAPH